MADKNVLDLTTDTDRPVVSIDGIAYPLRTARDLTLQDFKHLERISIRTGDLMTRTRTLTKAENHELTVRLIRTYGGTFETWAARTPTGIVVECLRMIPRLQAEESIRRANEISVGTGALKNPRAVSDEWERQARGDAAPAPATPRKPALF